MSVALVIAESCFRDALTTTLSALYGKLLVVMGIAFPMAEVISTYIPPSFYEVSEIIFSDTNLTARHFKFWVVNWGADEGSRL